MRLLLRLESGQNDRAIRYILFRQSPNIVARINLPNMRHGREQRVEVYLRAQEGLAQLEPDPNKRLKYIDFIAQYANLNESEQAQYEQHLQQSSHKEVIMGPVQQAIEKSIQQGFQQGIQQGIERGVERGIQRGREEGKQEKAIEIARTLLNKGMNIGEVSEISRLSEEEIRKLSVH